MYVENMQVGVLTAENAGTGVINAPVAGNTAAQHLLPPSQVAVRVMVVNYGFEPETRRGL